MRDIRKRLREIADGDERTRIRISPTEAAELLASDAIDSPLIGKWVRVYDNHTNKSGYYEDYLLAITPNYIILRQIVIAVAPGMHITDIWKKS